MRRRTDQPVSTAAWVLIAVVFALTASLGTALFIATREDVTTLNEQDRAQKADIDVLRDQVIDLGGVPEVPPAEPANGRDGIAGRDGRDGSDGRDGADGSDGQDGRDGRDGQDGADGKDGRDGVGLPGPPGEVGPIGPAGQTGATGGQGPAPLAFSFMAGSVVYSCTDPDLDGLYQCEQQGVMP